MKKRCLTILFVMLVLIGALTVPAFAAEETSGSCGKDITWSYNQELQLLSIFGSGTMYDYGEGLAPWAEWADEISEVQISSGIYNIGHNAFYGCSNLYFVDYLGTLEQWTSLTFQNGNEQLGLCAIECTDLPLDADTQFGAFKNTEGSAFWIMDGQGNLTVYGTGSISRDSSCGPANGIEVPWEWWREEIVTVTVKEGITTTSYELFADCVNLKRAVLPDSLRILDASTFSGCTSLEEVEMPNYQGPFTLGSGAFLDCASLKAIELPPYTKEIEDITFQGCSALEEINIPEGVKTIGSFAFFNCSSLKTIYLPSTLDRLKQAVNINHYGESPFTGCTSLTNIFVAEGNKYAVDERGVLFDTENNWLVYAPDTLSGSYTIPDGVTYVWAGAFENCVNLTEIHIPDSVDYIHNEAFRNCTNLKEITIPNSVVDFGYEVFLDCTALERVTLSNQITVLDSAFQGCTALRSVKIPDSVTELGYKTFSGCTALEEVKMSENTELIGKGCFENCTALKEIHIPETVTEIGEGAFRGCSELIAVDYAGFEAQWAEISIAEGNEPLLAAKLSFKACAEHDIVIVKAKAPTCTADGNTEGRSCSVCGKVFVELEVLPMLGHTVTDGVCTVCGEAVDWYYNASTQTLTVCCVGPMDDYNGELDAPWDEFRRDIKHVVIADGVTRIGNAAFAMCSALETVTIADSVTEIGEIAFQFCERIQDVKLPEGLVTIGGAAFNACSGLKVIYIPASVLEIGDAAFAAGLTAQDYIVHPDNPNYCSDSAGLLFNKDMTKLIQVPAMRKIVLLPDTLKEIGPCVFSLNQEMVVFFRGTQAQWDDLIVGFNNDMLDYITINCDVNEENYCDRGTHFTVEVAAVAATCTEEGLSEGAVCTICGLMVEEQKVLPKLPHAYENGVCTMCGVAEPEKPVESPFTDVQTTDWFFAPVLWAKETGVTGGKTATTFAPDESCTRAQVVTFLWAANGKPAPKTTSNPFTDVPNDAWYLQPVLWAVENGVTGGTSPTTFGPDNYCTRAQVVTFLYAAAGKPEVSGKSTFEDVADTDWFAKPVIWAKENNVTGGISPTQFGPNNVCTRAQVVTFLYSSKDNMSDTPDTPDVPDVPDTPDVPEKPIGDHVAYGAVRHELWQSAANTPLDQLPVYNDTATYEGIQQILDTCNPDGALMFRYNPHGAFGWVSPYAGMTSETNTAIHETYHGFSHTTTYYLEDGYYLSVPGSKVYSSEEMTVMIPAENRTFRFDTYVGEGSNLSSNLRGIYGLMNEFNAYQMGMNYGADMFDYYCAQKPSAELWFEFINGCENDVEAYSEFRYFILTYLLYAKEHYPDIYEGLMNNEKLRYAFTIVESNFAEDIARYEAALERLAKGDVPRPIKIRVEEDTVWIGNQGIGRHKADYDKLMAVMSTPAYTEMMETFTLK